MTEIATKAPYVTLVPLSSWSGEMVPAGQIVWPEFRGACGERGALAVFELNRRYHECDLATMSVIRQATEDEAVQSWMANSRVVVRDGHQTKILICPRHDVRFSVSVVLDGDSPGESYLGSAQERLRELIPDSVKRKIREALLAWFRRGCPDPRKRTE